MELFTSLLIAHLLGDFFLQSKESVRDKQLKGVRSRHLYSHGVIHGALNLMALLIIIGSKTSIGTLIVTALLIAISHIIIDLTKSEASNRVCKQNITGLFVLDQLSHVIVLFIACHFLIQIELNLNQHINTQQILIHLCAFILLTKPSSLLIQTVFKDLKIQVEEDTNDDHTPKRVGQAIGILERVIIYFAVLAAQWQAIGFLIAAKSIFRFGDLNDQKNRNKAEMILLGTLLSFGIGITISWLAALLINS